MVALLLGVEEVGGEADAGLGTVVADNLAGDQLVAEALGLRMPDRDCASPVPWIARGADLEACLLGCCHQVGREGERALADPLRPDAGNDPVAAAAGRGRDVRCAVRKRQGLGA